MFNLAVMELQLVLLLHCVFVCVFLLYIFSNLFIISKITAQLMYN